MDKKIPTKDEFAGYSAEDKKTTLVAIKVIQDDMKAGEEEVKDLKQLTMLELKEIVEETMKKSLEPLTKVDRKYWAFPGIGKV